MNIEINFDELQHSITTLLHVETEKVPEEDQLVSIMCRTSIIETLPSPIKNKLEDVVGLTIKDP